MGRHHGRFLKSFSAVTISAIEDGLLNKEIPDVFEIFKDELRLDASKEDVGTQITCYFHLCNLIIK